jgi:hypothetical protein
MTVLARTSSNLERSQSVRILNTNTDGAGKQKVLLFYWSLAGGLQGLNGYYVRTVEV